MPKVIIAFHVDSNLETHFQNDTRITNENVLILTA